MKVKAKEVGSHKGKNDNPQSQVENPDREHDENLGAQENPHDGQQEEPGKAPKDGSGKASPKDLGDIHNDIWDNEDGDGGADVQQEGNHRGGY